MIRSVTFSVPFMRGQGRPRVRGGGHGLYKAEADRKAEGQIAAAFEMASIDAYGQVVRAEAGTPVSVAISASRNVRSDLRKRDGDSQPDTSTPDVDNIAKLVLDGLNGIAWADDAQVDQIRVIKEQRRRGAQERTLVRVEWRD